MFLAKTQFLDNETIVYQSTNKLPFNVLCICQTYTKRVTLHRRGGAQHPVGTGQTFFSDSGGGGAKPQ